MNNKFLIISEKMPRECELSLEKMGYNLVKLPEQHGFETPVSSHPDMFVSVVGNKILADTKVHTTLINKNSVIFVNREVECEKLSKYPWNIGFNCACVGNLLFCNERYLCEGVRNKALELGIKIVNVKQGYAKCSTAIVSDKAIITEDDAIEKAAVENGLQVLKIRKGYVQLCGYDYGFIGGSCGLIEKHLLAFCGNVFLHPDAQKIIDFCYNQSVGIVNLSSSGLCDVGSIVRIY